ncbi:MAG: hypothetical protein SFV32_04385 [Opitutaceae bacterium]|nr:hypothetical protein [Opitutaceae bacterium]
MKVLFDENTGGRFVGIFREVISLNKKESFEIAHTVEKFGRGAKDADWIPKLKGEDWVVISDDRGRNSAAGDRLPQICESLGITLISVNSTIFKHGGQAEKMRGLNSVWPEIVETVAKKPGSRWLLKYAGSSKSTFKLECKFDPGAAQAVAPVIPVPLLRIEPF